MTLNNGTENVELLLFRTVAILGASLWIGYWHGYSALLELLMALVVLALGGVVWLVRLPHPRHGSVVGGDVPD